MKALSRGWLSLLALAWFVQDGRGQTAVLAGPGGTSVLELESISGGNPLAAPLAGGAAEGVIDLNFGFNYVRPIWPNRSLALSVPGSIPNVAVIGGTGDLPWSFAFIPRVDAEFDITSLGITAAASIEYVNVTAKLDRTLETSAGILDLTANENLSILVVNLIEISKEVAVADYCSHAFFEDDGLRFTLGTRFAAIQQQYNATLRNTGNISTADGSQNFAGLGLTAAVDWVHPLSETWSFYSGVRGSVMLGYNTRKSTVSVVSADNPGANFTNNLIENKTSVLPVGELEMGLEHRWAVGQNANGTPSQFVVRAGLVGQVWGTASYLSASQSSVSFSERPLYLVGFTLTAGLAF